MEKNFHKHQTIQNNIRKIKVKVLPTSTSEIYTMNTPS